MRCVSTPQLAEQLDYDNPLFNPVEAAWYDGKKYGEIGPGIRIPMDPTRTEVAQEHVIACRASDRSRPELVPLQLTIHDSTPARAASSPIWRLDFVIVPRSRVASTIGSAQQARDSGHPIVRSDPCVN